MTESAKDSESSNEMVDMTTDMQGGSHHCNLSYHIISYHIISP